MLYLAILLLVLFIFFISLYLDIRKNNKIIKTIAVDDYAREISEKMIDAIKRSNSKDELVVGDGTFYNVVNYIMNDLETNGKSDFAGIEYSLEYMDRRYDCSDFRLPSLIRIMYDHDDKIPDVIKTKIKKTLLNFKYWMDQPGDDSMCYWSENHQILFSSGEYLIGRLYPNEVFTNTGLRGKEHSEMGKKRVLNWLEQRFLYGFTEWYSSTYYVEDIAPLSVLVDYGEEEISKKAKMILDLMIYDLATQNYKGTFVANSGRMYEPAKMSGTFGTMRNTVAHIWPEYKEFLNESYVSMQANFKHIKKYKVPKVLKIIGLDQNKPNIYKATTGLNISELKKEGLLGQEDKQIMMQFNMESFTNPIVISNTVEYLSNNGMLSNEFLSSFRTVNLNILKKLKLHQFLSKLLKLQFDGTAIQRANTYMYRTQDYAMSTAQAYHPGMYGDQHSLFSLNINNDINIFNQHPAKILGEGALSRSPNYWVGNGIHPHTVQDENINISIYILPNKTSKLGSMIGMNNEIEHFTHTYFPKQYMDEVLVDCNYAFGKIGDTYVALIGKNELKYKPLVGNAYEEDKGFTDVYDLIQEGLETFWITEVGNSDKYNTFDDFIKKIKLNKVEFNKKTITYETSNKKLELTFKGDFKVNGKIQDLEYDRFDSKYSKTKRKSKIITIEHEGKKVNLDFYNCKREVVDQGHCIITQ